MKAERLSLDRLSNLPLNIIENILCFLPIQQAARTSILSRNWRYNWLTTPKLEFIENDFEVTTDYMSKGPRMVNALNQILSVYRGPINEFTVSIGGYGTCVEIDQIIRHILRNNNVDKVTLALPPMSSKYRVPLSIFSLPHLTYLYLRNCEFDYPSTSTTLYGSGNLTSLHLVGVEITGEELLRVISRFPLLKSVTLDIHGDDYIDREDPLVEFFKCLPVVEHLSISHSIIESLAYNAVPLKLPTSLLHLKSLSVDGTCFSDEYGLPFVLLMMRYSPNLEKLKLRIEQYLGTDECEIDFADYSDIWLENLNELEIIDFSILKPEMEFLKLILAKSPVLKKVNLDPYVRAYDDEELQILRSILRFPLASSIVDIIVEPCPDLTSDESDSDD